MYNLLLKMDGFPPAVLFALLLHAGLIWFMLDRAFVPSNTVTIEPASVAVATAKANPQTLRRIQEVQIQRANDQRAQDEARAREQARRDQEAAQKAEADRQLKAEADRKKAEQQKQEMARLEEEARAATARRQAELDAQRKAELQRQLEEQARAEAILQAQTNSQNQGAENDLVAQYVGKIMQLITQNWDLPPSARNGMTAVIRLQTTPIGDITSSAIIQSSGDAAFDRSVEQAVARVGDLQELRDLPSAIYEKNFRTVTLTFSPEDLLR